MMYDCVTYYSIVGYKRSLDKIILQLCMLREKTEYGNYYIKDFLSSLGYNTKSKNFIGEVNPPEFIENKYNESLCSISFYTCTDERRYDEIFECITKIISDLHLSLDVYYFERNPQEEIYESNDNDNIVFGNYYLYSGARIDEEWYFETEDEFAGCVSKYFHTDIESYKDFEEFFYNSENCSEDLKEYFEDIEFAEIKKCGYCEKSTATKMYDTLVDLIHGLSINKRQLVLDYVAGLEQYKR